MHAFQFSRPFSRALVRVACLHIKGLSALLPEHKIGTGEMLDFCCFFFSLCCEAARVFHPSFFTPLYLCHSAACLLPVLFSGHLSIARQSGDVFFGFCSPPDTLIEISSVCGTNIKSSDNVVTTGLADFRVSGERSGVAEVQP